MEQREQLESMRKIKQHVRVFPSNSETEEAKDFTEEINAIETAPLAEEKEESFRHVYAVVPEQPEQPERDHETIEVPDEEPRVFSPMIFQRGFGTVCGLRGIGRRACPE